MHLNFHFFKFLCPVLNQLYQGMELGECFSQSKDELIMGFYTEHNSRYIRAHLTPANPCLAFPEDYKRSKKNSVNLFPELIGEKVEEIKVLPYERAFSMVLTSGKLLLFKLHGNRSNILLYHKEKNLPQSLFRNELKEDKNLALDSLNKEFPNSWERFKQLEGNAASFLPTLGKIPREWLKTNGYIQASLEERWALMQELLDMLNSPLYSIFQEKAQYKLSLLPVNTTIFTTADPIEACNEYFRFAVVHQAFDQEKNLLTRQLEDQQKKTTAYLKKTKQKLSDLYQETPPSQLADIIMANLHQIPTGSEKVTLFDFYQNQEITVQLKRGLSPQKQAENLYRKSKNRKIELQQLNKNISEKEGYLNELQNLLGELEQITHFKALREFAKNHQLGAKQKGQQQENIPFKRFEHDGFEIWVGKSAKANDEMLRYFAWKEDLWLHAKDVSGSHVLVKNKSGQSIPKTTLERAAEMAAYYSKNKNESLAAVMYTPCKYVRKVKGSAPGAVMVDKESVLMVQPKGPH